MWSSPARQTVDLQRLKYFIAVAEERHITRAAARLGMAQPPLSQQIRILEAELGTKLFERLPKGVALTAAGEALLEDARSILDAADRAGRRVRRIAHGEEGELVGGITTSAALHPFVPNLLRCFHDRNPKISYDLHENNAAEITETVLTNRMAFGIIRAPVIWAPTLTFVNLGVEPLVAALSSDHSLPLRKGRYGAATIEMKTLADQNFILVRRQTAPGMYANILEAARLCGFEPRVVAEVGRMLTNLNLVAAGIGVSCVPESMQRLAIEGIVFAGLEVSSRARKLLSAPLTLVHHTDESRPSVLAFIDEARRLASRRATVPAEGPNRRHLRH
jgi:DNA-binding transcriptional LysR family regulator